jgi:predicted TIM-barrel fold metal-dependent hydrolase
MYDVHTHFIPPAMMDWLHANAKRVGATLEERVPDKEPFLTVNGKWSFELKREFTDATRYLEAQSEAGVRRALVSPVPQLFLYELPPEVTAEAAQVYNRSLQEWISRHPDRLAALATVPLNQPDVAAKMLESAMEGGLKGAIVGPGHAGHLLSDQRFEPFWQVADAQQAIVFIHPLLNEDPRIQRNRMPNLIGVPWETTICALDLILSGTLDHYPRVKILLAHGGGFLPYQIGRIRQGYEAWPAVRAMLEMPPEDYLRRFYYDSVLWHPEALRFLCAVVGEVRVLPGSDYPFDLCAWPPPAVDWEACRVFLGD